MRSRIVHIISGLSVGDAEKMLLKLLMRVDRRRFSIPVISLTNNGKIGNKIESIGTPVLALEMDNLITDLIVSIFD